MMERKFTDDEIVKALECCNKPAGKTNCELCPFYHSKGRCTENMLTNAIDLINRQKAEIERLREAYALYEETTGLKWARAEAIKEFADRLTNNADLITVNHFDSKWAISQDEIDNLVKEMTGEDNGN